MKVSAGSLLIAPPTLPESCFTETVHIVTHYTKGGSFALCVNQQSSLSLKDVLTDANIPVNLNFPMYWGGPVEPNSIWMLHDSAWECTNTISFHKDWAMTSSKEMLHMLADGNTPQHFRLMYGFCSWGRGQLDSEIAGEAPWSAASSWLIADNPGPEWLFDEPIDDLWHSATMLSSKQAVNKWI